jgi:hypothetical protein
MQPSIKQGKEEEKTDQQQRHCWAQLEPMFSYVVLGGCIDEGGGADNLSTVMPQASGPGSAEIALMLIPGPVRNGEKRKG